MAAMRLVQVPIPASLREFVSDLDQHGRLRRVPHCDQDRYQASALLVKLLEVQGDDAPGFRIENIRVNGRDYRVPVVGNILNGYPVVARCFGVETEGLTRSQIIRRLRDRIAASGLNWKKLPPEVVSNEHVEAPDLEAFPWIRNSPADGSAYINAGCVAMRDPELGYNLGVYRLQVLGPLKLAINCTASSHGRMFMARALERGEEQMAVAIAVGADPITFMMASTRLAGLGESEYELAGGFSGTPLRLMRCRSVDLLVPASSEIVIEGEVLLNRMETEGPYGEYLGYVNQPKPAPVVQVTAVTHRPEPILYNIWSGIERGLYTFPQNVCDYLRARAAIPELEDLYCPMEAWTLLFASIRKDRARHGIQAGQALMEMFPLKKVIVVADHDVDVTDTSAVLHAMATRWQASPASRIVDRTRANPNDPSNPQPGQGSKIVIDATRQRSDEGGPSEYAAEVLGALRPFLNGVMNHV
jgi:UbiD family decarboxylase